MLKVWPYKAITNLDQSTIITFRSGQSWQNSLGNSNISSITKNGSINTGDSERG